MNVYRFIKNFICPFCNKAPKNHIPESEHVTGSEYACSCRKTKLIDYPRSEMLIVTYHESLEVRIAVDAKESIFQLIDPSDAKGLLCYYNEIPHFYDRPSVEAAICFLETMVTFQ